MAFFSSKGAMTSTSPPPRGDHGSAVARLADLDTFPGATSADLEEIVSSGQVVSVPQGWSVIWDRTPADKAYVILDGSVEVRRGDELVATLAAGQVIGEVAILNRKLRSATVTAATPLTVLHFTREAVERLYAENAAVQIALRASARAHS
jgi:CRP/FNR family cyclic AMP-dependent transcriptional regulator